MSWKIETIHAHEILDSRGDPTVQVSVLLDDGTVGNASVPSGASTGSHEAVELRDGDKKRFGGKGVQQACGHVNHTIAKSLRGKDVRDQILLDQRMVALDGTQNKARLGANAILGVSLALAHTAARASRLPLYAYLRKTYSFKQRGRRMPLTMMNFVNGGRHADTDLDIQEIMLVPLGNLRVCERVRMGAEVFHALGEVLRKKKMDTDLGNEGGYAPKFHGTENAFTFFVQAIKTAGYVPGRDAGLAIDVAASEFYDAKKKQYFCKTDKVRGDAATLMRRYEQWMKRFPLVSIEDPFAEDDWDAWQLFTKRMQEIKPHVKSFGKPWIVGDDLFVTNSARVRMGIELGVADTVLIKPNQIGTLSETIDTVKLAQKHGYRIIISHRSGETCDTTIADLAVAVNADAIKTGSVARSERVAKYNRLMEIEEELG